MTKNLDNLTPDQLRRVDALIHTKVLGKFAWFITEEFEDRNGFDSKYSWWAAYDKDDRIHAQVYQLRLPYYTTDPAAALELLLNYSNDWTMCQDVDADPVDNKAHFFCNIWPRNNNEANDWFTGQASTLPLAIVAAVCQAEGLSLAGLDGPKDEVPDDTL